MSTHYGDYATGTTVNMVFDTFAAATGAPTATTNFAAADINIYKNLGTTQRSSANGITVTTSFDSITGMQAVAIDLSDNTDAGFYAAGNEYQVMVTPITADGQTMSFWLGTFSIQRSGGALASILARLPNATPGAAGGVFIAGTNAATTVTTSFTTTFTGNLTGSVASVTGAVGSVTGNVGGNVVGSVASVTGNVGGNVGGSVASVTGNVGGNVVGSVASVTGNVGGNVVGTVASVVGNVGGNVGGNVVGSVASVTAAVTVNGASALTEAYPTKAGGLTLASALYGMNQMMGQQAITSTTLTVLKRDQSTTAMTFTLDSAIAPTSITRAT